jgi:hypothetical protein
VYGRRVDELLEGNVEAVEAFAPAELSLPLLMAEPY